MSKLATEFTISNSTSGVILPIYSSNTISMGSLMRINTGNTNDTNYVGPFSIALARPNETLTTIPIAHVHVVDWSSDIQWVIGSDNATAAATRRFTFFEFNKRSLTYTWKGFINMNHSAIATVHTMRGHRTIYQTYTAGTVSISGTSVTGIGTTWTGSSLCTGSRIGFGSTTPSNISQWYQITGLTSNTGLTIDANAGASGSTSYVIEDLKILFSTTNATAANGGLFLIKGIRYEDFIINGLTVTGGTMNDNQKGVYWLADAATVLNTAAAGLTVDDFVNWNTQYCYVLDTSGRIYKYNFRIFLGASDSFAGSVTSGKSTKAFVLRTGIQAVTGTMSQNNNGRIATLNHGPANGINSLYFATTTRVYRVALSNIVDATTTWQSDIMAENAPGTANTFAATGALNSVEILSAIDRIFVATTHAAGTRSYITQYRTDSGQMDHIFLGDTKQLDQSTVDANTVPYPNTQSNLMAGWSENGYFHIVRQGTTSAISQLYCLPTNADWAYASLTNQRVIFPKLSTFGANKFYRGYVTTEQIVGSTILGHSPEPIRLYARNSGIDDNSGSWTLLDDHYDLSSFAGSDYIQFMSEFRCIGFFNIPNRIHSICVVYEDNSTDSHYQPSVANSSISSKNFAWRFSTAFGSSVPPLRVRVYDAVSGGLLLDDNTSSPTGTFEKSTDGGSNWVSYDTADKANETTYIRYTPLSLGDNIKVRALLTQL